MKIPLEDSGCGDSGAGQVHTSCNYALLTRIPSLHLLDDSHG